MSFKVQDNTRVRIGGPCLFINPGDPIPPDLHRAIASVAGEQEVTIIKVVVGNTRAFFIDCEELGDCWGVLDDPKGGFQVTGSIFDGDRRVEALKLFVDACGAGFEHFACWEEFEEFGSKLTEKEFDALYGQDAVVLEKILKGS